MEIKDIENLAELAKIELSDKEKESLLKDLDGILDYVKQVSEVEVKDSEVEYKNKNVWREDMPNSSIFSPDLIIKQFPDAQDNFVKVKKIL
jgi:aspartyl-tRNA(Asn)/glutamyl-tRNA(Gln) amidotransferase subunit C